MDTVSNACICWRAGIIILMQQRSTSSTRSPAAKVFLALWPSAVEREQLRQWQAPLLQTCGGRAMQADTLHCTLVFVGLVVPDELAVLQDTVQNIDVAAFDLWLDRVYYWGHNHIIYAAPSCVPQQMQQLVGRLEQQLTRIHIHFDRRSYQPHVTLLRNARCKDTPLPAVPAVCWRANEYSLVQSTQQGYRVLANFPLLA